MFDSKYFLKPREVWFRRWSLQIHSYIGLAVGLILIGVGITGSLLVFWLEFEAAWYPELSHVQPGPTRLSIQSLVDSVAAQYRDAQVGFHLPEKVDSPLVVRLRSETLQKSFRVFVNPYTGQILGALGNQPWLLDWVFHLHGFSGIFIPLQVFG